MPIEERLVALHAHYVRRINAAVAAGRLDLVHDLVDEYEDEALEGILEDFGPAEILEAGGGTPWWQGADRSGRSRFWFWRRRGA
jgi:hypothetical protein